MQAVVTVEYYLQLEDIAAKEVNEFLSTAAKFLDEIGDTVTAGRSTAISVTLQLQKP
jgi:hypothetical protein